MSLAPDPLRIGLGRLFTSQGVDPYDEVVWEQRQARITNLADGSVVFAQDDVEFPAGWSQNATNIVAQKYFRGILGTPERESSLRQVVDRVVDTITRWGLEGGYFSDDAEASAFSDELKYILVTQRAAFNSPVWFNIGVPGVRAQASACFILDVDDTMDSILNWYREEGIIFKGGSGAGTNLSRIRSSVEQLNGGGTASGPVSFMRGADASAGTIKSGGKTRRAAKMVVLNADHPDIEEFIWCKALEERKARVLSEAGFDMDLDGRDAFSVQYQNANNSVRVTDEFMQAVIADADWELRAVTTGEVIRTVKARDLWRQIAAAAWECADPGIQFDTTINRWHTLPTPGESTPATLARNTSASTTQRCNLASMNLLRFLDDDRFDVDAFRHTVEMVFTAQEILVGRADYPTEQITENAHEFRQLGLGYTNLGAMLMALGLPYDSIAGRAWAAAITSLMTGHAYATSARTAARMGPFGGFAANEEHMLRVLRMHRDATDRIEGIDAVPAYLVRAAQQAWEAAVRDGEEHGVRNSQATVLAPTGTISFMLDCDTTGVEPDLSLVKSKKLVGGGTMSIVNQTVPRALRHLGYDDGQIADIVAYIDAEKSIVGAPHLSADHLPVFACSMGDNPIHYEGHVRMLAAVQPFLSGRREQDDEHARDGHRRGGRAPPPAGVGARPQVGRHLPRQLQGRPAAVDDEEGGRRDAADETATTTVVAESGTTQIVERIVEKVVHRPVREKLPRSRTGRTFEFRVADCKGFATIGEYDDGRPGEVFLTVSKQGSTLAGIMDAFAKSISYGLQYGVPLRAFVEAFTNMRFEPAGMTDDPEIRFASSVMDYLFRKLAMEYMTYDERPSCRSSRSASGCSRRLPGSRRRSSRPARAPRWLPTRSRCRRQATSPTRSAPVSPRQSRWTTRRRRV